MENSQPVVYQNGEFISSADACIPPSDRSFLMGDGIFETLVSYRGEPFASDQHHERLSRAARVFELQIPEREEFLDILRETVAKNELAHARIRVTVSRTESGQNISVTAGTVPEFRDAYRLKTVAYTRNENGALAGLKTTSYGENVIALREAQSSGADEAVFANTAGNLCEGTATNLFAVKGDKVITPPLSSGCLPGVTRGLVIELCGKNGISCEETDLSIADFRNAPEAFLSSTLREIRPVSEIDGRPLDIPENGIASQLAALFAEMRGPVS